MTEIDSKRLHQQCWQLLGQQRFSEAVKTAVLLTQTSPANAESWYSLSYAWSSLKHFNHALAAIDKSLALTTGRSDFLVQKAYCQMGMGDLKAALELADKSLHCSDDNPEVLTRIATVYQYCDELDKYLEITKRVVDLVPDNISALSNYSEALRYSGDYTASVTVIDKVLALNPEDTKAYYDRSQIRTYTVDDNHIDELKTRLSVQRPWRDEMQLCYGLAKELEDIGHYQASFHCLNRGSALRRDNTRYRVDGDIQTLQAIKKTFSADCYASLGEGYTSKEPLFILGLPRSGTTLVERILGAHSDVFDAGELRHFSIELVKQIQHKHPDQKLDKLATVQASAALDWRALGNAYIDATRPRTGHSAKFVDKMPQNYLYIGLIAKALPNAKIILIERNPMDVCYAMYKTLFGQAYPFTYCLQDLGRYYVAWRQLMDHWQALLPDRILSFSYEQLVQDTEPQVRELLSFCDLDWQPGCLEFHRRRSGVSTASASQVRQAIYSSSMGKWRNVEQELEPLIGLLSEAGIAIK